MQKVVDVIGSALASYYHDNQEGQLIIREDCRITSIPVADFFRHPNNLARDRIALSHCKGNVLNLGASSGEHALYLLEQGLQVISMDTSSIACDIMKKRGLPIVICGDIFTKYKQLETTDTWLALKGVIGQLGNIDAFCHFTQLAEKKIPQNGRLILSSINLRYEGYRTRKLSFEYANHISDSVAWFDIGITTLSQIAKAHQFSSRIIYCDENNKYIAVLTKQ